MKRCADYTRRNRTNTYMRIFAGLHIENGTGEHTVYTVPGECRESWCTAVFFGVTVRVLVYK